MLHTTSADYFISYTGKAFLNPTAYTAELLIINKALLAAVVSWYQTSSLSAKLKVHLRKSLSC